MPNSEVSGSAQTEVGKEAGVDGSVSTPRPSVPERQADAEAASEPAMGLAGAKGLGTEQREQREQGDGGGAAVAYVGGALALAEGMDPRDADEAPALGDGTPNGRGALGGTLLGAVGVALAFFMLLPPLSQSGLWDPYELNIADLARRVALNLLGASNLALTGADNTLPFQLDLGKPQLPFSMMAIGFRLFGLHEWAGRLPLAFAGLVGVVATYGFVGRLSDRRAGLYAAVALSSMPLYFVQARSMMGDIVGMAAFAMAFGGLSVAAFDGGREDSGVKVRGLWLAVALVGLLAGFHTRGGILGVASPLLGVGCAYAVIVGGGGSRLDSYGNAVGMLALMGGVAASVLGIQAFLAPGASADLRLWFGAMVHAPSKYPTFDAMIAHIGHAAAPWSAFVPFALGRLFIAPRRVEGTDALRETYGRVAVVVGLGVAFTAQGVLVAHGDFGPFVAVSLLAAACGIAIRDFDRGAHASVAVGVGTVVLLGVFHHDFHQLPEKAFGPYGVVGAVFPDGFKDQALRLWWVSLGLFALVALFTFVERDASREPFHPTRYRRILDELKAAWGGLLALTYFAAVAGAAAAAGVVWLAVRFRWSFIGIVSIQTREAILNSWWLTALVPLVTIFGFCFAADLWLWAFNRARPFGPASFTRGLDVLEYLWKESRDNPNEADRNVASLVLLPLAVGGVPAIVAGALLRGGVKPALVAAAALPSGIALFLVMGVVGDLLQGRRAMAVVVGGALSGLALSGFYYPALANQLSPKDIFETYARVHKDGEPLALSGVGGRTAAYYAGGQPPSFDDPRSAYDWLMGGGGQRRFLAVKAEEMSRLNQFHRQAGTKSNLPVIDGRSSQVLLVASSPVPGQASPNPFDKMVLSVAPPIQYPLDVNLDDKLAVLGYDLVDASDRRVDVIAPGRKYHLKTYYRVISPIGMEWEMFVHIDGFRRRHNGDHKPLGGKYPMTRWTKDDIVVDDYEFTLEPNFSPGQYTLYFGFFIGESRLKVKSGPQDGENRINGGPLRVQ